MSYPLCVIKRLALFYLALSTSALLLPSSDVALGNSAPLALPFNESSPASILLPANSSASAPFVYEILSANASVLSTNFQAEANVDPICDGSRFDKSLNLDSCTEAWNGISVDTYTLRLGQKGFGPYDVQLPRRHSSCLNKKLVVVISLYKPSVTCFGTVLSTSRITLGQELLDMLPVGLQKLVFGLFGEPRVQEIVPDVFTPEVTEEENIFEAVVDVDHDSVSGRWFDLWAGAYAVDAICVDRQRKSGSPVSPGGLKITLDRVDRVLSNNLTATS
ncbi:MAG: hypothetical protein ASARMPRED_008760 [Alectoria sarmentosa]|nr:MAG: hypothetical protein ASARMPRED_008760 [Alectoria sarmentosa]